MDDTTQDKSTQADEGTDEQVLDPSGAMPADDATDTTDENPVEDAEEDVEEPVDDDDTDDEEEGSEEPVLGLGDDDAGKPSDEEVEEKADEKSKEEGCEFC